MTPTEGGRETRWKEATSADGRAYYLDTKETR